LGLMNFSIKYKYKSSPQIKDERYHWENYLGVGTLERHFWYDGYKKFIEKEFLVYPVKESEDLVQTYLNHNRVYIHKKWIEPYEKQLEFNFEEQYNVEI
jgi:hypothetical protein